VIYCGLRPFHDKRPSPFLRDGVTVTFLFFEKIEKEKAFKITVVKGLTYSVKRIDEHGKSGVRSFNVSI